MIRGTRRAFLASMGTAALAGCLNSIGEISDGMNSDDESPAASDSSGTSGGPPTSDISLPLPDSTNALSSSRISGGVRKDGIPSIDDPEFINVAAADRWLVENEPVFGVDMDGEVKAYPQRVLVWHEVVNDRIGDENISVTYCPLTGTVLGFKRGETEFGVSGQLINSNLVMYDRGTDSLWPQMLATAVHGPLEGSVLQEFPVTWTSWGRWRDAHPETHVLSEDTGFARNYERDPYGSYNPPGGFYADDSLYYDPYTDVDRSELHIKDIVLGARSNAGAIAVHKESLANAGVLEAKANDVSYVTIYDPVLDTGYIYQNPEELDVSMTDGTASVNGENYSPSELPLGQMIRFDSFWFAWAGYYPESILVK